MDIASYCYSKLITTRGIQRSVWKRIRKWIIRYAGDPQCRMTVHGRELCMPLSHDLPFYLNKHSNYDLPLGRLGQFLHSSKESIFGVDVGANIGDTVAALAAHPQDQFLAVEPNPHFFQYLVKNWAGSERVIPVQVICSSSDECRSFSLKEGRGTATVVETFEASGREIESADALWAQSPQSLDTLVGNHAGVSGSIKVDVIKIDTDGHDFEVLSGARKTIARDLPCLFFESYISGNQHYSEQLADHLSYFGECGYSSFLVYDNTGFLMGQYELSDRRAFDSLVLYQLTSPFLYFDVLVMKSPDIEAFHALETQFYINEISDSSLQSTAQHAADRTRKLASTAN